MEEETPAKKTAANCRRYCNALFGEAARQLLAARGEPLPKKQLAKGLKAGKILRAAIAQEHSNKLKYNEEAHPSLQRAKKDPPKLAGPATWQPPRSTLREPAKERKKAPSSWEAPAWRQELLSSSVLKRELAMRA